jgi:hypothetical protein
MYMESPDFKFPKLGSIQDRVFRRYMVHKTRLKSEETKLLAMVAVSNLNGRSDASTRSWVESIGKTWSNFQKLLFGIETTEQEDKDDAKLAFYMTVVKKMAPKLEVGPNGGLMVTGF